MFQAEGLKLTISRGSGGRGRKPKRSRLDLEVDRIARLRDGGESECSQSTTARGTPDSFINGMLSCTVISCFKFTVFRRINGTASQLINTLSFRYNKIYLHCLFTDVKFEHLLEKCNYT